MVAGGVTGLILGAIPALAMASLLMLATAPSGPRTPHHGFPAVSRLATAGLESTVIPAKSALRSPLMSKSDPGEAAPLAAILAALALATFLGTAARAQDRTRQCRLLTCRLRAPPLPA
jgi:hypothetical protein